MMGWLLPLIQHSILKLRLSIVIPLVMRMWSYLKGLCIFRGLVMRSVNIILHKPVVASVI
ncbi:hypothetical protein WM94_12475 [Pseudomonas sp. ABFPK]|nr:hypothetical protein WM94_12475 [Pseudomonas sp. ABFPK]